MDQITIGVFAQIFCGIVTDEPGRSRKTAGSSDAIAASPAIGNYPVAVQAQASSTPDSPGAFAHTFRRFQRPFPLVLTIQAPSRQSLP